MQHIIPMELTDLNSSIEMKLRPTYGGLPEYGTAEGDMASFITNINYPLKELEADIVAQQDLHGYSHPWAGGAGKNILPNTLVSGTLDGITYTANDDGSVTVSGTATNVSLKVIATMTLGAGTYKANGGITNATVSVRLNSTSGTEIASSNGNDVSFTLSASSTIVACIRVGNGVSASGTLYPMIRLSSVSDATYEPYANICPIVGYDDVDVNVTGKNLLAYPYYNGTSKTSDGITFTVNSDGSVGVNGTATANTNFWFCYQDTSKTLPIGTYKCAPSGVNIPDSVYLHARTIKNPNYVNTNVTEKNTFTITEQGDGLYAVSLRVSSGTTVTNGIFYPMVVVGSETNTSYEPYKGNTYTTDLGSTYYGGTLNVTTGVLTVTHGYVDLGTLTWNFTNNSQRQYYYSGDIASEINSPETSGIVANIICSNYNVVRYLDVYNNAVDGSIGISSSGRIAIYDTAYTSIEASASDFKTAMSGVQLVYELATPQTVQLSPQEVETVVGQNHIWANSGQIYVEFHYVEDFEE